MKATVALGLDLYREIRSRPGNLLVSPLGIWYALALVHPGARGKARAQLSARLGIDDVAAAGALGRTLAERAQPTEWQRQMIEQGHQERGGFGFHLEIANQLWIQSGYRIATEYGERLTTVFGADPAPADFRGAPEASCEAINRWVSDRTHGRIRQIVSPSPLLREIRALLANAVYFKAAWADEFYEAATAPRPFHLGDGTTVEVPTMARTGSYGFAEDADLTAVELRYIQPDVALVAIVPRGDTFDGVDRTLTLARVEAIVDTLAQRQVDLQIPRFRFETSLEIADSLRAIGLDDVLSAAADLSGISDEPGFAIGDVVHRTFIDVNEKGTEAAAVTALALAGAAMLPAPVPVRIDRPFYVLIRDVPTGTALFFGRVVDPR